MQSHGIGDHVPALLVVQAGERRHEAVDAAAGDGGEPGGRRLWAGDFRQAEGRHGDVQLNALLAVTQPGFAVAGRALLGVDQPTVLHQRRLGRREDQGWQGGRGDVSRRGGDVFCQGEITGGSDQRYSGEQ